MLPVPSTGAVWFLGGRGSVKTQEAYGNLQVGKVDPVPASSWAEFSLSHQLKVRNPKEGKFQDLTLSQRLSNWLTLKRGQGPPS